MVIAVDFDGTIVEHRYPKIGKQIPFAIDTLKQLQNDSHILILWTVREGELLQEAIDYCKDQGWFSMLTIPIFLKKIGAKAPES